MRLSQAGSRFPLSYLLVAAFAFAFGTVPCGAKKNAKEVLTVAQLTQKLAAHEQADGPLADELAGMQLSERLSTARLNALLPTLPGAASRSALTILADRSSLLAPPASDVESMPTPTAGQVHGMLVKVVSYVNTALQQLPNFLVTKTTIRFEDRPHEDALEAAGVVSYSYQPLHYVGSSVAHLGMRDHREFVDESRKQSLKQGRKGEGMATSGEFGSVLISVLSDALKGKITWARWEKGASGPLAVFAYKIPEEQSNYRVQFCCIVHSISSSGTAETEKFDARSAYHGEIEFNPNDGSIWRVSLDAELPEGSPVPKAGMIVEYGPTEIGGRTYICPRKSISIIMAHTAQPGDVQTRSNYKGPVKTFLNEVAFGPYRRFGSEVHIVSASN